MTRKFKYNRLPHAREGVAQHVPTLGEHMTAMHRRNGTARAVGALKASCEPVAAATRIEQASRFLSRFFVPGQTQAIQRDALRIMLDMLERMTANDIAELDRIRRHLRGE